MSSFRAALTGILIFISICQSSRNLLQPKLGKLVAVLFISVSRGRVENRVQIGEDTCSVQLQ